MDQTFHGYLLFRGDLTLRALEINPTLEQIGCIVGKNETRYFASFCEENRFIGQKRTAGSR